MYFSNIKFNLKNNVINKKRKKFALFFVWLLSYILIVAVMFFSYSIGILTYDKSYRNQIDKFHTSMTSATASGIKEILIDISELQTVLLSYNSNISEVLSIKDSSLYFDSVTVMRLVSDMSLYETYKSNISLMYIYIEDTDTIINETGIYNSEFFYDIHFKNHISYDDWKRQLKISDPSSYYTVSANIGEYSKKLICFSTEPNILLKSKNAANSRLIIGVDEEKFFRSVDTGINYCDTYLFDSKGKTMVYSLQTSPDTKIRTIRDLLKTKKSNSIKLKNINFLATTMTVALSIPNKYLQRDLVFSHIIIALLLIFSLILSSLLIIYFMKKNYFPLDRIMSVMNIKKSDSKTEITDLDESIKQLFINNNTLSSKINVQSTLLKDFVLIQLISGNYTAKNKTLSIDNLKKDFINPYYAVICFSWSDISEMFDSSIISYEEKEEDLFFIIQNIFEELLSFDSTVSKVIKYDRRAACIINSDTRSDEYMKLISDKLSYGRDFIFSKFNVRIYASVSQIYDSVYKLDVAYKEAKQSVNYQFDFTNKVTLSVDSSSNYEYPIDIEEKIIASINSGDSATAENLVSDVLNKLYSNNRSSEYIDFAVMSIITTLMRVADSSGKQFDFSQFTAYSDEPVECRNMLISCIRSLCDTTYDQLSGKSLPKKILEYVLENYSDSSLGVNTIALHFGISSFYVSKIFKEAYSYTLVDFINKYRLEKVKELINENKYSFVEISDMVGYYHVRTFNRVFKKYFGMTPSEYKKNL